jgi:hypothetical protein
VPVAQLESIGRRLGLDRGLPFIRVLPVITGKLAVEFRVTFFQGAGDLEECFGGHGKEFGGVFSSVRVKQSLTAKLCFFVELLSFPR